MIKNNKVILPGAFLPAAERYNAIVEVDKWVIENYFKWLANNPKEQQKILINVNKILKRQLKRRGWADNEIAQKLNEMFHKQ